jgi:hypothetical protein
MTITFIKYIFRLKIQPFVTEMSYQDPDGFAPWIRISTEVKSRIRIRIETHTGDILRQACIGMDLTKGRCWFTPPKSLSQPLKAQKIIHDIYRRKSIENLKTK